MEKCENCGNSTFNKFGLCMQCGHGPRIGPAPASKPEIRRPTKEELAQKRMKSFGRELTPEEAAAVRKRLGMD